MQHLHPPCTYKIANDRVQDPEGTARPQWPPGPVFPEEGQPLNTARGSCLLDQLRAVGVYLWPWLSSEPWPCFIPPPCWGLSVDTLTNTQLSLSHMGPVARSALAGERGLCWVTLSPWCSGWLLLSLTACIYFQRYEQF